MRTEKPNLLVHPKKNSYANEGIRVQLNSWTRVFRRTTHQENNRNGYDHWRFPTIMARPVSSRQKKLVDINLSRQLDVSVDTFHGYIGYIKESYTKHAASWYCWISSQNECLRVVPRFCRQCFAAIRLVFVFNHTSLTRFCSKLMEKLSKILGASKKNFITKQQFLFTMPGCSSNRRCFYSHLH